MTATVFFKINEAQNQEIKKLMQEEGYTSKAEFFRFLVKFYKYNKPAAEQNFEQATQDLASVLRRLDQKGKLNSSIDDQLTDV